MHSLNHAVCVCVCVYESQLTLKYSIHIYCLYQYEYHANDITIGSVIYEAAYLNVLKASFSKAQRAFISTIKNNNSIF